jgi:hypothetical protein
LRLGFIRATLINKWVIAGYHLGWPKVKLAAIYKQPPQRSQKRTR